LRDRFPPPSPAGPWADGRDDAFLRDLLAYWRDGFDWREQEALINALPQFTTEADRRNLQVLPAAAGRVNRSLDDAPAIDDQDVAIHVRGRG
jgi:microsomal epoxide hydrolase